MMSSDTYRILSNGAVIGTSRLERRDVPMEIAFGVFYPLPPYETVRAVFLLFTEAQPESGKQADQEKLSKYYAGRDALSLSLETENGPKLETGYIHIVDWGPKYDADLEVEVQVKDASFWSWNTE